jgi:heat shock protein HtpX
VYTRYPEGLATALLKIAGSGKSMGEVNRAVAPMFIVNPLAADGGGDSAFSTHPPLYDRIRVLRTMAGASFVDYNRAFQNVKGKSVIGQHTLHEAKAAPIREASNEPPLETREETKAIVHRMYGYADVKCQCGAMLRVPSTYREPTVRCIRCGVANAVPTNQDAWATTQPQVKKEKPPEPEFFDYTRKSPGAWESFPCKCGNIVQVSPMFSAPMIQCRKCGTHIRVKT